MNTINRNVALVKRRQAVSILATLLTGFLISFLMLFSTLTYADLQQRPPLPSITLPDKVHGKAAVDALGKHLADVAAHYGMTGKELRDKLLHDQTIWLDQKGRLFYIEEQAPQPQLLESTTSVPQTGVSSGLIPLDQAFLLHSLPGSNRVIYLDFDGHVTTGSQWNSFGGPSSITSPPFDTDGNPTTFNDSERRIIISVWKRVAEDYAPFNVDVTTQDPGKEVLIKSAVSDTTYGIRVVIGGTSSDVTSQPAGGISYINSFGDIDDTPAFVFPVDLYNYDKYMADTASHEAGHTLGLHHDGTVSSAYFEGHGSYPTSWGPLMGSTFYKSITQWSKGEYANANNQEDDVLIINNKAPYRIDDTGNDFANAKMAKMTVDAIDITRLKIDATGIIETSADVDMLSMYMGVGSASFTVYPADLDPNLDLSLALYDVTGNILTSVNNPGVGFETLTVNIPIQGLYYLAISGSGAGDPRYDGYSKYGSLGQYLVTGSVANINSALPTAVAKATPVSGSAPLTVAFDATGSSDPDGSIAAYSWKFGDGGTSTQAKPSYTYNNAGKYTATLTITDNAGFSASSDVNVTVKPANYVAVDSIVMAIANKSGGTNVTAMVTLKDAKGNLVDGTITGYWSGTYRSISDVSATTRKGVAKFDSGTLYRTPTGTFYFNVINIAANNGLTYYPDANKETVDVISK